MKAFAIRILAISTAISLAWIVNAQAAPADFTKDVKANSGYATLHLETGVGSFKSFKSEGKLQFSFEGTILIHAKPNECTYSFTGQVKLQKEDKKHDRAVYFGKGTCTLNGKWVGVQWFGKNMEGMWYGKGGIRLAGEFFKDRKTGELRSGTYWFDDPKDKNFWYIGATQEVYLPKLDGGNSDKPRIKPGK